MHIEARLFEILTAFFVLAAVGYGVLTALFATGGVEWAGTTALVLSAGLSLIIYSGGAQFLALALIGAGAPVLVQIFTLVAMGLRHLLYGPALLRGAGEDAARRGAQRCAGTTFCGAGRL